MNEIIKDYIRQTSCKTIINKLQNLLTYVICRQMDEMPHWKCVWKSNMEISCKEVTYSCM